MKKHLDYLWYVLRHKWYVALQCIRHGLFLRAFTHDCSKFLPSEWFPYVNYFFGFDESKKEKIDDAFDRAWLRHQHRNRHHWQWWILREDGGGAIVLPMGKKDRLEMMCDWWGASKAQGNGGWEHVNKWYKNNKNGMQLHAETQKWVEWFLEGKKL